MKTALFCLAFATYSAHTMDSMMQADWRLVFPYLDEEAALSVYILGHVPLVALVFWLVAHESTRIRGWSRLAFCGFLVLHVGVHESPQYRFDSLLSQSLIYSAGAFGLVYIIAAVICRLRGDNETAAEP
jgi:hypothetical protein